MAFITREDGEHFVIPSYRDVLTGKSTGAIRADVMTLSQSYGEYITMQRKGQLQYEIAFSPESGYLLGETVWYKFNRPTDMIYCEAIPNTSEAILVIVKNGSVYLDGSFQIDNIPEELVIFLTQQNNFEIYVYGDVPISATSTEGKFSFDETSVKSFTVLDSPIFNSLPLIAAYHLLPVDATMKAQGIGGLPIKTILIAMGGLVVAYLAFGYISPMFEEKKQKEIPMEVNPYAGYVSALNSPAPADVVNTFIQQVMVLHNIPGWYATKLEFKGGTFSANVYTKSGNMQNLYLWSKERNFDMTIKSGAVMLVSKPKFNNRIKPKVIYPLKQVIVTLIDKLFVINPNYTTFSMSDSKASGPYGNTKISIRLVNMSPDILSFLAQQLEGMPITIDSFFVSINQGIMSGTLVINAYGT